MMHAELPEGRLMVVRTILPKKPIGELVVSFPRKKEGGHRFDEYYSYGSIIKQFFL